MKVMNILKIVPLLSILMPSAYAISKPSEGEWAIMLSAFGWFSYENNDARGELPQSIIDLLDTQDLTGSEDDLLNVSIGLGYYLSDKLQARLIYTDGLELGLYDDFDNFLVSGFDGQSGFNTFDADMTMLALDAKYSLYDFNNSLSLYVAGGIVAHRLAVSVSNVDDGQSTMLGSDNETSFGASGELGLQWHISDNLSAALRYSHYTFMSIDHTSFIFEYRF